MKRLATLASLFGLGVTSLMSGGSFADEKTPSAETAPKKVVKSEAEWKKILTPQEFYVTRMKATEPAGTGKYAHYRGKGTFACVCCGTELFDARHKFESGTGWPSFYRPLAVRNIATAPDFSTSEVRTEVTCAICDAHLGHVFGDGPMPTGLRYCLNSAALKLVKTTESSPKQAAKSSVTAKTAKTKKRP